MAKNVLDAQRRLILQNWMKKVKRSGFVDMQNIGDISKRAAEELGLPISPVHIRNNARILDIRLPRSYKNNNALRIGEGTFSCTCGRKYKIITE